MENTIVITIMTNMFQISGSKLSRFRAREAEVVVNQCDDTYGR